MKKNFYRLFVCLLALVLLSSGGYLLWKNADYQRGAEDYAQAAEEAEVPPLDPVPLPAPDEPAPQDPNPGLLENVDLDNLRAVNEDVLGWIVIPDTLLSYPIVQCGDNQYYLNRTWQGKRSSVGAIFMECQCSPDFSDFNTIIYGHRMNNESMFGTLRSYENIDFWREHPSVYVVTDDSIRVYDICSAFEVGIQEIVYRLDIEESALQQELIDFSLEHSVIDTGVVPTPDGQMLTLSTCTGHGHSSRWVVQAVLRKEAKNTSAAKMARTFSISPEIQATI